MCLAWLNQIGLLTVQLADASDVAINVSTQRTFTALDHHATDSRPDLMVEVYWTSGDLAEDSAVAEVIMFESKIGSREGPEQLRRYVEHLDRLTGFGSKTLVYITRGYDPKEAGEVLVGLDGKVWFEQLRWHDFYRFLQTIENDALIEEVMTFMEEQGMARGYRLSAQDLVALSGVPRAFEIFDETLGGEVKAELEAFAGSKVKRETHGLNNIRWHRRYITIASLHEWNLYCFVGYQMEDLREYPTAHVWLEARPGAVGRETSVAAMRCMSLLDGWEAYNLESPTDWAGVYRAVSLADLLSEVDHVAAVKHFFVESIRQLREELTAFKKEHPDLPWTGP